LNGRKAYEMAQNHCFDLILMDVQMPEMDGFQATAAIREWEQLHNRRTPILAMTANALKGDRELCLSAGMDGYVTKPVNMQDLRSQIETVLASA
jgi:CheY-like chemotaxis protein